MTMKTVGYGMWAVLLAAMTMGVTSSRADVRSGPPKPGIAERAARFSAQAGDSGGVRDTSGRGDHGRGEPGRDSTKWGKAKAWGRDSTTVDSMRTHGNGRAHRPKRHKNHNQDMKRNTTVAR